MAVGDFWGTTACLCLLAFVVGCSEPASTATVSGVVTLDGKPLEFIHVEFWPENGQRSFGKTDSEGRFELLTDDRSAKGAVPGTHKVSLRDTWPTSDDYIGEGGDWVDMSNGRKSRIHSKYYDAIQSPLEVTVEPDQDNFFEFTPEPRK